MSKRKIDLLKYKGKKARIDDLCLLENGDFVDYYCVKIGGVIFSDKNGNYRFLWKEEANIARLQIQKTVSEEIKKLENLSS